MAVVAYLYLCKAITGNTDVNLVGAGVEGILDEFLDDRRRRFNDFARGDLRNERFTEFAYSFPGLPANLVRSGSCDSA